VRERASARASRYTSLEPPERDGPSLGYPEYIVPQTVEISLRIPSLRIRRDGKDAPETISNSDVRFCKHVELESIPKPGAVLPMAISSGETFECDVVQSTWHDQKNLFVVACRYAKRSVTAAEYHALINSSDWHVRPLL
jgi:hypothetical protein